MWTVDELNKIEQADELRISPLKADGSLQKPVIIWVVRVGQDVYVRSYKGRDSIWFRNALASQRGRIWAGGVTKDVQLIEAQGDQVPHAAIDAAYAEKYGRYPRSYVDGINNAQAKSATIQILSE